MIGLDKNAPAAETAAAADFQRPRKARKAIKTDAQIRVEFIMLFFNIKFAILNEGGGEGYSGAGGDEYFSELSFGGVGEDWFVTGRDAGSTAERPNDHKKYEER